MAETENSHFPLCLYQGFANAKNTRINHFVLNIIRQTAQADWANHGSQFKDQWNTQKKFKSFVLCLNKLNGKNIWPGLDGSLVEEDTAKLHGKMNNENSQKLKTFRDLF